MECVISSHKCVTQVLLASAQNAQSTTASTSTLAQTHLHTLYLFSWLRRRWIFMFGCVQRISSRYTRMTPNLLHLSNIYSVVLSTAFVTISIPSQLPTVLQKAIWIFFRPSTTVNNFLTQIKIPLVPMKFCSKSKKGKGIKIKFKFNPCIFTGIVEN